MKYQFDSELFLTKVRKCDVRNLDLDQIVAFEKILPLNYEMQKIREIVIGDQFPSILEALACEDINFGRVERFAAKMMIEEDINHKVQIIKRMLKFFVDFDEFNRMIENLVDVFSIIT